MPFLLPIVTVCTIYYRVRTIQWQGDVSFRRMTNGCFVGPGTSGMPGSSVEFCVKNRHILLFNRWADCWRDNKPRCGQFNGGGWEVGKLDKNA